MARSKDGVGVRMDALRTAALRHPGTEEGVACAGTALETRTARARGRAFVFLGKTVVRLKLAGSLPEAAALAKRASERCEVGAGGWIKVTVRDDDLTPLALLERWIDESYRLFCADETGRVGAGDETTREEEGRLALIVSGDSLRRVPPNGGRMPRDDVLARATEFLWTNARLVERRLFERSFAGGSAGAVVEALRPYRNADGGFGHALEADLRAPSSQPIHVDFALTSMQEAGARDADLVAGACAFLARVARADGAVPYVLPDAMAHARADHWQGDYALAPSLHATSAVAGRLHALGARHEWLDRATAWCFEEISGRPTYTGHRMLNVMEFLAHAPDRERACKLWGHVAERLFEDDHVALAIPQTSYGLTPLKFAPSPKSPARAHFADDVIEAHLDYLVAQQEDDGGWPIAWPPPGPAAAAEWRGKWTLDALRTLRAYGRI